MSTKQMGFVPIFRPEMGYTDYVEKRQLFLRSYHFSRKQSISERIKKSFFRVKKVIRVRLRSVKRLRKIVWFRLKHGFFFYSAKKRKFLRLHNYHYCYKSNDLHWPSSCLW